VNPASLPRSGADELKLECFETIGGINDKFCVNDTFSMQLEMAVVAIAIKVCEYNFELVLYNLAPPHSNAMANLIFSSCSSAYPF